MQAVSLFYIQEILIYGNELVFIVVHFQIAHLIVPVYKITEIKNCRKNGSFFKELIRFIEY